MVDWYGRWMPEPDYSTYPKVNWCDMDYMAAWIREEGYEVQTSLKNLITMIFLHFKNEQEENLDLEDNLENWKEFVLASGGLQEFDYWP